MFPCRLTGAGRRKAIGKTLVIVGEQGFYLDRAVLQHLLEKRLGAARRFVAADFNIDPAGCPVDGHKQIAALRFIGHLRQVFIIDVQITRLIALEGFGISRSLQRLRFEGRQFPDPMAVQATCQAGAR